jgi:hypothetical protein
MTRAPARKIWQEFSLEAYPYRRESGAHEIPDRIVAL